MFGRVQTWLKRVRTLRKEIHRSEVGPESSESLYPPPSRGVSHELGRLNLKHSTHTVQGYTPDRDTSKVTGGTTESPCVVSEDLETEVKHPRSKTEGKISPFKRRLRIINIPKV